MVSLSLETFDSVIIISINNINVSFWELGKTNTRKDLAKLHCYHNMVDNTTVASVFYLDMGNGERCGHVSILFKMGRKLTCIMSRCAFFSLR